VRDAPWFAPKGVEAVAGRKPGVTPPPPVVLAIREDSLGRLWIISVVASRDWRRYETPNPARPHLTVDPWLEVIDPERGVVVARKKLPVFGMGFVGDDMYSYEEDEAGAPIVRLWRLILREP
jgi:hypothetical protein